MSKTDKLTPLRRRQLKAEQEADRRDGVWFRKHPDRILHIRPSIPCEFPAWGRDGHEKFNWMVVLREERGFMRMGVSARNTLSEMARTPANDAGSAPIVMGDTTINISGNADQTTLALMRAELDARDRTFVARVRDANVRDKNACRGAYAD